MVFEFVGEEERKLYMDSEGDDIEEMGDEEEDEDSDDVDDDDDDDDDDEELE